ncbi:hypothetical protein PR002_g18551 [Phytophthora rubi]|uniref:Uncharacterized protein n=1 Tax=Phytophthora rubi TaxID=129364 RepID=A0A6A3K5E7_9STRA|nr:hypothetical protein PR002_g18551 [Phytophthora rubi]
MVGFILISRFAGQDTSGNDETAESLQRLRPRACPPLEGAQRLPLRQQRRHELLHAPPPYRPLTRMETTAGSSRVSCVATDA